MSGLKVTIFLRYGQRKAQHCQSVGILIQKRFFIRTSLCFLPDQFIVSPMWWSYITQVLQVHHFGDQFSSIGWNDKLIRKGRNTWQEDKESDQEGYDDGEVSGCGEPAVRMEQGLCTWKSGFPSVRSAHPRGCAIMPKRKVSPLRQIAVAGVISSSCLL